MIVNPRQVRFSLRKLGNTPSQISESLKTKGIKGAVGDGTACPLTRYLYKEFPYAEYVSVCDLEVTVLPGATGIEPSKVVASFVNMFDDGNYPELEEG